MKYLFYDLVLNNPKRVEIYLSGCSAPHCVGCHNPESWDFDSGYTLDQNLIDKMGEYKDLYDNIWILGGEPLDQVLDDLIWLLDRLQEFDKKIWLFTRYEIEEINKEVLSYCDFVKTGRFVNDNSDYMCEHGFKLGSSNQKIHSVQSNYKK